ncbi:MAG: transglutaminase domain-containing protein [Luteolibacter sp.]|uniref:transglutaminase-like domain-containing protein n=1 Tax=Luteolibacter sp. TaxID=1962973 RepID=UPI0032679BA5
MSLLFWGAMTGRPVIGLILALVVEISHWVKIRWDFDEGAYSTAWQLTTVIIALTGVLIYLDGSPYVALPQLLTWLPLLLLPMQFVQSFGMNESMPLITFSFLAKHRRKRNLRLGLNEAVIHIHFGNVYFVAILIASTLGDGSSTWQFLPGIIILTGWMLLSATRSRPTSLIAALAIAGGIAVTGRYGLERLDDWLTNRGPGGASFDPDSVSTMIGRIGTVQQSPDIVWRLKPASGMPPPRLLRTATYNSYQPSSWIIEPATARDFRDLDLFTYEGQPYYRLEQTTEGSKPIRAVRPSLPRFQIRGSAFAQTPLSLPGDTTSLFDFQSDAIEHNALGTVHVFPRQSVVEGTVLWRGDTNTERTPLDQDLVVPFRERATLNAVLAELKLNEQPTLEDKLKVMQAWFMKNFRYTRDLKIKSWTQGFSNPTALTQFLTTNRSGHCEYFAAAVVLLLREAKIPARYATGYVVVERDPKHGEYVIRGTHGHAWCRVWDADKKLWIDFDTTPPSWTDMVATLNPSMQAFNDALKRFREDFFLWRNRPGNRLGASVVMFTIALGVMGFVFKRLWKTKRRLEEIRRSNGYDGPIRRTPLNALEKQAEKQLGPRPLGQPFGAWFMKLRPTLPDSATLDEAVELHQRLRFDPTPAAPNEQDRLAELAKQLESAIKRGSNKE